MRLVFRGFAVNLRRLAIFFCCLLLLLLLPRDTQVGCCPSAPLCGSVLVSAGLGGSSFVFVLGVERADRLKLHGNRLHDATVAERVRFAVSQTGSSQQCEHAGFLLDARWIGVAGLHVIAELGHLQKVEHFAICEWGGGLL